MQIDTAGVIVTQKHSDLDNFPVCVIKKDVFLFTSLRVQCSDVLLITTAYQLCSAGEPEACGRKQVQI